CTRRGIISGWSFDYW
nr:immunoglobulin heavy chain junction region [Macaca mulatta]MOW19645.1 immunoglobulin heavy chain junction region [Macaca mulatta]MOW21415.1 immunoglobulin heavy chain junction region [Macaca mulatta]MOW22162.1 immunoglobulin heavy chain junction region [Macaca mulatta]MOY21014.1 immunoglobulin heavy chain junction region [Macaca mulatta]